MKRTLAILCAVALLASAAQATTVTWKNTVASGAWHIGSNWDTGTQPVAGDSVFVNSGTQEFWGGSFGGMNSTIRNDSHVTINGGNVVFQGGYGATIGTGGSGSGSSLTVTSGAYRMSGSLSIGNAAGGEPGTLTIGQAGLFDAGSGSSNFNLLPTGTVNSAGTVVDVGNLFSTGGVLNVVGGTFTVQGRVDFESNSTKGSWLNITGGTLTANNSTANLNLNLGYGGRYFNFTPGSTGTLLLPNVSSATMQSYVDLGYVRLNGATSATQFAVTAYNGTGAQVTLVPEPSTVALIGAAALGLASRRRRVAVA